MDFKLLEKELKKRTALPYNWTTKQNNLLDNRTNFIYQIQNFDALLSKINTEFNKDNNYNQILNYALNRWLNFWSAKAVETMFCSNSNVKPHPNKKHKSVDFYIKNIPFDHKTTVFPKGFKKSIPYAFQHKRELIEWLYKNQSQQQRKHLENRLFIVLGSYNTAFENWKLKTELAWLKTKISTYLSTFETQNLEQFYFQNKIVKSDIIWAIK
ncbi:MAG TPA: hypothetical protein VJ970_08220 [Flavobacteriaceae bacterium]|nr:hypothetical protein [Flavobacteriaceae bacterium]